MFSPTEHSNMSTSLLSLPNELFLVIVGFLDHHGQLYAVARSCRRLYHLLRRYLLRCNVRHSKGSALIWAAKRDRRNLVRRLLRLGAPVNTRGEPQYSGTALHAAAKAGHLGMIELLLRRGGDPEACGAHGYKPLLLALWARNEEIAIVLFRTINAPNSQIAGDAGYTPLHAACLRKLTSCARVFLESGADVHARTSNGYTPLHFALKLEALGALDNGDDRIHSCTLELVTLLLDSGSRRDTRARILGLRHPHPQIRSLFVEHESNKCLVRTSRKADASTFAPEDLLDDEIFPSLHPLRTFREQQPPTGTWDPSRVEEIRQTLPNIESTRAKDAHRPDDSIDPFPKLIGRNSPHPLEYAARFSWMELKNPKMQPKLEEVCSSSKSKIQDLGPHVGRGSKQKRWLPVQLG